MKVNSKQHFYSPRREPGEGWASEDKVVVFSNHRALGVHGVEAEEAGPH